MSLIKFKSGLLSQLDNTPIASGTIYVTTDTKQQYVDIGQKRIQLFSQKMNHATWAKIKEMQALVENDIVAKYIYLSYAETSALSAITISANVEYDLANEFLTIYDNN